MIATGSLLPMQLEEKHFTVAMARCRVEAPPMVDVVPGHRVACWVTAPPVKPVTTQ